MALLGILETAIGLAFIYLLLSMLCSGINEWLAHKLGRRGKCLRVGLQQMLPDRWTYLRLLAHPAVASMYRDVKGRLRHPAYIPSATFVTALLDVVVTKAEDIRRRAIEQAKEEAMRRGVAPDPAALDPTVSGIAHAARICAQNGFPVGRSIEAILERDPSPDKARLQIAAWYDGAMQRVSGWYKRAARFQLFLIGLAAAVVLNVDSLAIGAQLLHADTLRAVLVADAGRMAAEGAPAAGQGATPSEAQLRQQAAQIVDYRKSGLQIGYACLDPQKIADPKAGLWPQAKACWKDLPTVGLTLFKVLGWLITAFAVSQGAPFWFDLMNRFISLRGAGPKPPGAAAPAR